MKFAEKLAFLQENHFSKWLSTRQKVNDELSEKQQMFCFCGFLATGMHENMCTKFKNAVNKETVKRLSILIPSSTRP